MIETREQRKKSTLLHRRKVGIIAFLLVVVILGTACISLFSYFNNTIPFKDADGTTYYIKKLDGLFTMTDKEGNILPTEKALDSSEWYYVTLIGTTVRVDQQTGEYLVRSIPALYYEEDGEFVDHELLTVFKSVESKNIRAITIKNQVDEYAFLRINMQTLQPDDSADFVLSKSLMSSLDADLMSYYLYIVGHPLVQGRLDDPIKDASGQFSEYGLAPEKRIDEEGNEYDYEPTTFSIETKTGEVHTIIIGDRLINGAGYYLQYQDGNGEKRDAVYIFNPTDMTEINGTNIQKTIFAEAKSLVVPNIIYPVSESDYVYVENFKIHEREEDGELDQIIGFTYIDMAEREDTVEALHPYKFLSDSYNSYRPNYDSIDLALRHLKDPVITDIAVLNPDNDDKVAYGLMKITGKDDEGKNTYAYTSAYTISFERTIQSEEFPDEDLEVRMTIYVSEKNENGNYYTFTEMIFLNRPEDTDILGISFDTICEVSSASFNFLDWEPYDWIYPPFMQYNMLYIERIELDSQGKNYLFDFNREKMDKFNALSVDVTKPDGNKFSTFGIYTFTDHEGYIWYVTDTRIQMYAPDGTEMKPSSRHYERNKLGEQAQVIDHYANADNGDLVHIEADKIRIKHLDDTWDEFDRSSTPLFTKLVSTITSTMLIDSYEMTEEEEKALISDPANKLASIKITDNNGKTITYEFFALTDRKSYIVVDGVGGFFIQYSQVKKIFSDAEKFLAGEIIDPKAGT